MTDNLPATTNQNRALIAQPVDTDSWTSVVGEVAKLASYIADTEFVPRALRGKAPAAAAAILYGREVGLPPMTALNGVHIIEGSPSLAAEQMRSLVFAAGHDLEFTETTGATCIVRGRRRGSETWTTVTWTIDMARAAGLLSKSNWKNYPRRMLQARASSELCEMMFPDVIHGFRSVEAAEDMSDETQAIETAGAPRATSQVSRTKKPRKAAALPPGVDQPAPTAHAPGRAAEPGIPLPGEAGYDRVQAPGSVRPDDAAPVAAGDPSSDTSSTAPDPGTDRRPAPVSDLTEKLQQSIDAAKASTRTVQRWSPEHPCAYCGADSNTSHAASCRDAGLFDADGNAIPAVRTDELGAELAGAEQPVDGELEPDDQPAEPEPDTEDAVVVEHDDADLRPISRPQQRMIHAKMSSLGFDSEDERVERLRLIGILIGREVGSTNDLTRRDASTLIDTLALVTSRAALLELAQNIAAEAQGWSEGPDGLEP